MNALGFLHRRSKPFLVTTGLLMVVALGLLDYLSGPDVSLFIFYLAPVFLGVWLVGRGAGLLMCVASALSFWLVAELTAEHFSTRAVPYWNAAVRLGFLVTFTLVASALKRAHEHERELARTDYLTGAVNFRHFTELAAAEINRAQRHDHPMSVAFMDVDDFKVVNDRFGHAAGDDLLRASAETVRAGLRSMDVVARLGGDEFAVLLPETGAGAADAVVRRLRRDLLGMARARRLPLTFSIGVVTWDAPPANVSEMLKAADRLMYAAKRGGKNRIHHETWSAPANAA